MAQGLCFHSRFSISRDNTGGLVRALSYISVSALYQPELHTTVNYVLLLMYL